MRILRIIASVDPAGGGPIVGIAQSIQSMHAMGHDMDIVSLDPAGGTYPDIDGTPVIALGPLRTRTSRYTILPSFIGYRYSPMLVPWLRRNAARYDAVIVDGVWNYTSLGTFLALRKGDTPWYVFTHGMLDPWFNSAFKIKMLVKRAYWLFVERHVLKAATAVLFTAEDEKTLARSAYYPYRATERVVGFGTEDVPADRPAYHAAFRSLIPALTGRRYLLFLSRIHPKKGCDILIEAFSRIASQYPDLDLVIAGPDELDWQHDLERQAASMQVADRIHWPGMVAGDAKWGAFYGSTGFVLSSHSENFGIAVVEAMACSRPVLITDKINIWEPIKRDGGGLVSTDTVNDFENILRTYLGMDDDERLMMGRAARSSFLAHFQMDALSRKLIGMVEDDQLGAQATMQARDARA